MSEKLERQIGEIEFDRWYSLAYNGAWHIKTKSGVISGLTMEQAEKVIRKHNEEIDRLMADDISTGWTKE